MMTKSAKPFEGSEIRQDLISEKWVVLATQRAKRMHDSKHQEEKKDVPPAYVDNCPFCNMDKFPQEKSTLSLPDVTNWRVCSFQNKYPALIEGDSIKEREDGIYTAISGTGFHEVVVSKNHNAYTYNADDLDIMLNFKVLRDRYLYFSKLPTVNYVQIIENHGKEGGASLEHMHSQIFALPIVPTDEVSDLLEGAEKYFTKNKRCGYCDIIENEKRDKRRVIFENDLFIVLAPFAPRVSFEQWILPKEHHAGFERLTDLELPQLVEAAKVVTQGLKNGFNDPPYNMFVYSSPCDDTGSFYPRDKYSHFHWQIRYMPRMGMMASFEMATGLEISATLPEDDAEYLRSIIKK